MLIPKKNKKAICQHLFKEGVLVAKKDFNVPTHPEVEGVTNLQVIKVMQSLESRGYVKSQFSWQYFYYFLTDDGIQYLREYLHLPADIVPATFKKTTRALPSGQPSGRPAFGGASSDEYRKKESAPGGFKPEFVSFIGTKRLIALLERRTWQR